MKRTVAQKQKQLKCRHIKGIYTLMNKSCLQIGQLIKATYSTYKSRYESRKVDNKHFTQKKTENVAIQLHFINTTKC